MSDHGLEIRPLTGALGAEIFGIDLSAPLDDATFEEIHAAWLEHLVLFFRDQELSPAQHDAFARRFGDLIEHPYIAGLPDYPEIIEIVREPGQAYNFDRHFHADLTFLEEPATGAALYARELPPYGGDTLFANMYLAYEGLSEGFRRLLETLEAVHESGEVSGAFHTPFKGMTPKSGTEGAAVHPVVRAHPETGRKALYVNPGFTKRINGMTDDESRPLLDYLYRHATRPEFTCRFRWRPGSLTLWDNRVSMHNAVADFFGEVDGCRRVMHRATIGGDRPNLN